MVLLPAGIASENAIDSGLILEFWMRNWRGWKHMVNGLKIYENRVGHGAALRELVLGADANYLMFIENDALVFDPHMVDACFHLLESDTYDVIGSPRMSCSLEIAEETKRRFPDFDYQGVGDKGPGMWPCFFFAKKEWLMKTDLHFGPKGWQPGEYIEELDLTAETELATDVNGWIVFQLRHLGAKIGIVPQHHLPPFDMKCYRAGQDPWGRAPVPWLHIGSLSAGVGDSGKDELMQYEYGRRKFFQEFIVHGASEDEERMMAYSRWLSPPPAIKPLGNY